MMKTTTKAKTKKNISLISTRKLTGFYEAKVNKRTLYVRNGYRLVQCDGEAHNNPHIDHCMSCLGAVWGWRVAKMSEITGDLSVRDKIKCGLYTSKVVVPNIGDVSSEELTKKRMEQRQDQNKLDLEFKRDILKELNIDNHPKAEQVYAKAWELGHAFGHGDVMMQLEDLVKLIK